jgi:hypothetical protein
LQAFDRQSVFTAQGPPSGLSPGAAEVHERVAASQMPEVQSASAVQDVPSGLLGVTRWRVHRRVLASQMPELHSVSSAQAAPSDFPDALLRVHRPVA